MVANIGLCAANGCVRLKLNGKPSANWLLILCTTAKITDACVQCIDLFDYSPKTKI